MIESVITIIVAVVAGAIVTLPALIVSLFKVNVVLGYCAILALFIGTGVWSNTEKKYPSLKENFDMILGFSFLLLIVTTMVIGMVWGTDTDGSFDKITIKLILLFYGGIGMSLLFSMLVFIPVNIALYVNKVSVVKKLESALSGMPSDMPVPLNSLKRKIGISNSKWSAVNLEHIKSVRGKYRLSPPADGQRYIISADVYNELKDNTEQYLLRNGNRNWMELAEEITQNSTKSFFLDAALNELVDDGIVDKKDIGQKSVEDKNNEKKEAALRCVYSHRAKPMKSTTYDEDFD